MTPPIPSLLVLLLLLLPGIFALGRFLGSWLDADRQVRAVLTPAFMIAPWMLAVHILGRLTQSFTIGLAGGTIFVSVLGAVLSFVHRKTPFPAKLGARASRRVWIGALIAMAILAPMAFGFSLHDELNITGHMSMASEMLNGIYPPRHLNFPESELNYHYGFDVMVAMTAALTRLRVDHAIDVATVFCWGWAFSVAWVIGERIFHARGYIVALTLLFGGGYPFWIMPGRTASIADTWWASRLVDGGVVNPPLVSYFFQHPWTLGLPLALSIFLLAGQRATHKQPRLVLLGLLFLMLSLSQFTLFLTCAPAIIAQEFFSEHSSIKNRFYKILGGRFSPAAGMSLVLTLLVTLLITRRLGGFFAHTPTHPGPTIVPHWGITNSFEGSLQWMAVSFGLLLPLGLMGTALNRNMRIAGLCLILGGVAVINSFKIVEAWDIVKFATVAMIFAGMFTGVVIDRLLSIRRRWIGRPLGMVLLAMTITPGLAIPIPLAFEYNNKSCTITRVPEVLKGDDDVVATYLRARMRPGEIVYRGRVAMFQYAQWAGLPQSWTERYALAFGFKLGRLERRELLPSRAPPGADLYIQENIRWFVLDIRSDVAMNRNASEWIKQGRAKQVMTSGPLRVVELVR